MLLLPTAIIFVLECSSLYAQRSPLNHAPTALDMMYKDLTPEAFFNLQDNSPKLPTKPARPKRPKELLAEMDPNNLPVGPIKPGIFGAPKSRDALRGYEHFDLSILDAMARQAAKDENFALLQPYPGNPDEQSKLIFNLCFALSYIWRRGRLSIRKYYHLRNIYVNHLQFEVGYMSHVIMAKYLNMVELYLYSTSRTKAKGKQKAKNLMTRLHLTHFLYSVETDSRTIEHLCNMMNELKKKYEARPYEKENKFDVPTKKKKVTTVAVRQGYQAIVRLDEAASPNRTEDAKPKNKAYIPQKIEETHKLIGAALAEKKRKLQNLRDYYNKYGHYPTTPPTQQPMRLWSPKIDYGWSGEGEW
ncbi:uncharacterized protein LOC125239367 [Leguminivora glycinivorella]|uniref:uncharacterized protein LOC125239367 n=1 Tax=Leguminivora glycinivorella TaxID=1035111 RepID=UPI00200C7516|nr:uncharacterized protein LOC125239367 [Leguminivora glycinivorella]